MSGASRPLALVTGGASGIGRAIVERLARDGYRVCMADSNAPLAASETRVLKDAGLDVDFHAIDLTDEAAARALVAGLPPLAVLVNNAGIFDTRPFMELRPADFTRMLGVNLLAAATLTQAAAQSMEAGGRIVNIASRAYLGAKDFAHYVASKAAIVGYTRASAMELAPRGIMVNAVAPGLIDTPILRGLSPAQLAAKLAQQPTGAAGRPEDVAHAVAFLASALTRFITGQVLLVDGGVSLGGMPA